MNGPVQIFLYKNQFYKHKSSIAFGGYQDNFKPDYFITKKSWAEKKHQTAKQTTPPHLRSFCAWKMASVVFFFTKLIVLILSLLKKLWHE